MKLNPELAKYPSAEIRQEFLNTIEDSKTRYTAMRAMHFVLRYFDHLKLKEQMSELEFLKKIQGNLLISQNSTVYKDIEERIQRLKHITS